MNNIVASTVRQKHQICIVVSIFCLVPRSQVINRPCYCTFYLHVPKPEKLEEVFYCILMLNRNLSAGRELQIGWKGRLSRMPHVDIDAATRGTHVAIELYWRPHGDPVLAILDVPMI